MKTPDRIPIEIYNRETGEFEEQLDLEGAISASWDPDDPGIGKAFLTKDGREIFNPVPMAPPVGYQQQDTMMQIMERMIKKHLIGLEDTAIQESQEESEDFGDVEDESHPFSPYEVLLKDEFPEMPRPEPEPAPPAPPPDVVETKP